MPCRGGEPSAHLAGLGSHDLSAAVLGPLGEGVQLLVGQGHLGGGLVRVAMGTGTIV